MPSIEIACIGLTAPLGPPPTSFAVLYEAGLRSHRSPSPRFQRDFDELSGSLYHLGDPGSEDNSYFLAYDLLSEESRGADVLVFSEAHVQSARQLMRWLLDASPDSGLLFALDWRFGPDGSKRFSSTTLEEFWRLHDSRQLLLNAAYPIEGGV